MRYQTGPLAYDGPGVLQSSPSAPISARRPNSQRHLALGLRSPTGQSSAQSHWLSQPPARKSIHVHLRRHSHWTAGRIDPVLLRCCHQRECADMEIPAQLHAGPRDLGVHSYPHQRRPSPTIWTSEVSINSQTSLCGCAGEAGRATLWRCASCRCTDFLFAAVVCSIRCVMHVLATVG
jgi:hypothetical protein